MERKFLSRFMIPCFLYGYLYCRISSNMDLDSDRKNIGKRIQIYPFRKQIRIRISILQVLEDTDTG